MRNIVLKLSALVAMLALLTSCFQDDRNNFLPDEELYLLTPGLCDVDVNKESLELIIIKSGKGLSSCDLTITVDEEALAGYNATARKNCLSLPENVFELSQQSIHFDSSDFKKTLTLSWTSVAVSALLSVGEYAVALTLESDNMDVQEEKSTVIVHFKK